LSFGGQGGGASGEIRYVISVDDSQAVQKLQSVSQQFRQMPQALDQATQSAGRFSQANADLAAELQATDIGAKDVATSTQSFGSVMKQNIGTIVSMASGILGLVSNYTSLQRTQLQINKLEVTEANQRRMLGVLTRQHAAAVQKYGANSQKALDIEAKINILQARHTNTLDQLTIRQEQQTQAQLAFGISVVQTGATVVQMATQLKGYRGAADVAAVATNKLTMSMRALKIATVIGAVLVAIEVAAQAIANNWGNIQQKLDELYNWAVKIVPALKPVIDAIWTIGKALTALFTGDIDALNKMFSKTAQAAPVAEEGIQGVADATTEAGKAANEAQQEYGKFLEGAIADIVKISQGKKGEKNDWMKAVGIKGDEKKKVRKTLDAIEDGVKEMDQIAAKINALEGFSILEKFGFDVPDDVIKDILNTLDSDFRDIFDSDNDIFDHVADIIEEKTPEGQDAVSAALAKFFAENPGLLEALSQIDPKLATAVEALMTKVQTTAQTALNKTPSLTLPPNFFNFNADTALGEGESMLGKNHNKKGGSLFQTIIDDATNLPAKLKEIFSPKNMSGVGEALATGIFSTTGKLVTIISNWFKNTFTLENFSTALGMVENVLKSVGEVAFQMIVGVGAFAAGFAKVAGPMITKWFKSTFTTKNFDAALKGVADILNTVGVALFVLMGEGWTLIKDAGKEIGKWFADVFTIKNFTSALDTIKTILNGVADLIFGKIIEGFGLIKDIGGQIIGAITSGWGTVKDKTIKLPGSIIDLSNPANIILPSQGPKTEGGTKTESEGLTDAEIMAMLDKADADAAAAKRKRDAMPDSQNLWGFDELFPTKNPPPAGPFDDKGHNLYVPAPEDLYNREHYGIDSYKAINFGATGGMMFGMPRGDIQGGDIISSLIGINGTRRFTGGGANPDWLKQFINPRTSEGGGSFGGFGGGAGFGFAVGGGQKGVGQKILDAKGSGTFAQIAVGAQQAQKALANLAVQGGKSMQILANLILKNTTNLMGNFVTIAKQSQLAQTSLANLANQGGNSMSILAQSAGVHTKSMNTYLAKTIPVAAQRSQKALANLSNQGSNSMSLLAKHSGVHTKSMNTYLAKTIPVAAQKSQTSLANLSNEGSKSMSALASATEKAASRIREAINSIPSGGGGGGGGGFSGFDGGGFNFASGGDFITNGPQMITVGESGRERVTITPLGASSTGGGNGATVNQTISLNIAGSDLINQRNLTKRIKLTVGEQRDKYG